MLPQGGTMTARELAIATIGEKLFERLVKSSGEAAAIKAAWHRMLAEQHQERARWQRARST